MAVRNLDKSDLTFSQDERIHFDEESHTYSVDGCGVMTPVSTVVAKFFDPFDAEKWSLWKCRYTPERAPRLRDEWAMKGSFAAQAGTYMHSCIENYINGLGSPKTLKCSVAYKGMYVAGNEVIDISHEWENFKRFYRLEAFTPFRTEWRIFDEDIRVAGTIDLLCSCGGGEFEIYDWKRSNKIDPMADGYNKYGRNGLEHLPDTTYVHYCLQQNLYRYILETNYGMRVSRMNLVVLHPDFPTYEIVPIPRLNREIGIIVDYLRRENDNL